MKPSKSRPHRRPRAHTGDDAAPLPSPVVLLYATLLVSALLIAHVVVRYDLYDREPVFMLAFAVALGAAGMWTAGQIQSLIFDAIISSGRLISTTTVSLAAASTEELAKLGVAVTVFAFFPRRFNDPLDGLIYGAMAGLGAALEESVAVLRESPAVLLPRAEIIRLSGHLIMGAITCAGLGGILMRAHGFSPRRVLTWVIGCPIAGFVLHLAWDLNAFSMRFASPDRLRAHTGVAMALMIVGLVGFRTLATVNARWSRTVLGVCDLRTRACPPA